MTDELNIKLIEPVEFTPEYLQLLAERGGWDLITIKTMTLSEAKEMFPVKP
jgi:hypothetical protein